MIYLKNFVREETRLIILITKQIQILAGDLHLINSRRCMIMFFTTHWALGKNKNKRPWLWNVWIQLTFDNYLVQLSLANWICLFREKKRHTQYSMAQLEIVESPLQVVDNFLAKTSWVNSWKTYCPIFLWQLTNTLCTHMAWKAKLKWELNAVSSRTMHWIIIGNCHIWASYLNPTFVLDHFNFPLNSEQTL